MLLASPKSEPSGGHDGGDSDAGCMLSAFLDCQSRQSPITLKNEAQPVSTDFLVRACKKVTAEHLLQARLVRLFHSLLLVPCAVFQSHTHAQHTTHTPRKTQSRCFKLQYDCAATKVYNCKYNTTTEVRTAPFFVYQRYILPSCAPSPASFVPCRLATRDSLV